MQCIILADETVKEELLDRGLVPGTDILWTRDPSLILSHAGADAILDMLFTNSKERLNLLRQASPALIVINSVEHTLEETDPDFVRINGWPTMLRSDLVEAAGPENLRGRTEEIFACFHRKVEWVPDEPGFITPRIISMIINEAFMALEEGVSTKEEIDTAMKLGTNYPYGPFDWAEKVGRQKVASLLQKLSGKEPRYRPATWLKLP